MIQTPRSVILIYGAGGVGKSTRLAEAAEWTYKTTGKKTRVVGADGGGSQNAFKALSEKGIVSYWPIDQWDTKSIFLTMDLATKGWWPEDVETPNSPLVPPVREWKACPKCGEDSGAKGLTMVAACASCKTTFAAGTVLKIIREPIGDFANVGLMGFEGMTSFGDLLLRRLRSVDATGGRFVQDGEFKIAASGMQHYGDAQNYLQQFIANVRLIPVPVIVWTALELRADEDGKPIYGPAGPGKKLTALCSPWFTDVLHLDMLPKTEKGTVGAVKDANGVPVMERKLFLSAHYPSDNPAYKFTAKTSAPLGGDMPLVIEPSMEVFFVELEKAFKKATARLEKSIDSQH